MAKKYSSEIHDITVSDAIESIIDSIAAKHNVSKKEAKKLIANALCYSLVSNEIENQVHYLVTGEITE
jgi:hypothetical protein